MRGRLEYQADQIEMVLYSHKVPGRVLGGVVTPRWVRFEVMPALGARVSSVVRLSEEIALRLGSGGVRVRRQGSTLRVEVPREEADVRGGRLTISPSRRSTHRRRVSAWPRAIARARTVWAA